MQPCPKSLGVYSIVGSMSKKTPKSSPKGRVNKEDATVSPYMLEKMKVTTQCFIDTKVLEKKGLYLFKGKFHTPKGKKVHMVALPDTFQQRGLEDKVQNVYAKLGIEGYFKLPPQGIDVQRAYELMNTIDKIEIVTLIGKDGQPKMVVINEHIVQDTLHFKEGYEGPNRRLID